MSAKPETRVVKKIVDFLTEHGCFVYKTHGSAMTRRGRSDIIGVLPDGKFLAIEVKADQKGKVTELQKYFIKRVLAHGGVGFVSWSVPMTIDLLKEHGYEF